MNTFKLASLLGLGLLAAAPPADAQVYCTGPGVPVGCVVRPDVGAPSSWKSTGILPTA